MSLQCLDGVRGVAADAFADRFGALMQYLARCEPMLEGRQRLIHLFARSLKVALDLARRASVSSMASTTSLPRKMILYERRVPTQRAQATFRREPREPGLSDREQHGAERDGDAAYDQGRKPRRSEHEVEPEHGRGEQDEKAPAGDDRADRHGRRSGLGTRDRLRQLQARQLDFATDQLRGLARQIGYEL
jgi:hypothetical protein